MGKWNVRKILFFFFLMFSSNLAQTLISPLWGYSHPFTDLPLLAVIFYAKWNPSTSAITFGWLAGLLQDISSGGILGINSLSKLVVAFTVCEMEEKLELKDILIVKMAFVLILTALDGIIGYLAVSRCFTREVEPFIFNLNFFFSLLLNPFLYFFIFHSPENLKRRRRLGESY